MLIHPDRRRTALAGFFVLALAALACTCGPLSQVTGAQATLSAAQETLSAAVTQADQFAPTLEALASQAPELELTANAALATANAALTSVPGGLELPEIPQWASGASATSEYGYPDWGAVQATGEPNTPECGDHTTAWASATSNSVETLTLTYDVPVIPTRIEIHQSYNPGAITEVIVRDASGNATQVFSGPPQVIETCPYVMVIEVTGVATPISTVEVRLDQTNHPSWNEIDAVLLVGRPAMP